jgi:hypothetical protein
MSFSGWWKWWCSRPEDHAGAQTVCSRCRHANQQTEDAQEGLWACPWIGATSAQTVCPIRFADTGRLVFEPFHGDNGTWGSGGESFRSLPAGYEHRAVTGLPAPREPFDELSL